MRTHHDDDEHNNLKHLKNQLNWIYFSSLVCYITKRNQIHNSLLFFQTHNSHNTRRFTRHKDTSFNVIFANVSLEFMIVYSENHIAKIFSNAKMSYWRLDSLWAVYELWRDKLSFCRERIQANPITSFLNFFYKHQIPKKYSSRFYYFWTFSSCSNIIK